MNRYLVRAAVDNTPNNHNMEHDADDDVDIRNDDAEEEGTDDDTVDAKAWLHDWQWKRRLLPLSNLASSDWRLSVEISFWRIRRCSRRCRERWKGYDLGMDRRMPRRCGRPIVRLVPTNNATRRFF